MKNSFILFFIFCVLFHSNAQKNIKTYETILKFDKVIVVCDSLNVKIIVQDIDKRAFQIFWGQLKYQEQNKYQVIINQYADFGVMKPYDYENIKSFKIHLRHQDSNLVSKIKVRSKYNSVYTDLILDKQETNIPIPKYQNIINQNLIEVIYVTFYLPYENTITTQNIHFKVSKSGYDADIQGGLSQNLQNLSYKDFYIYYDKDILILDSDIYYYGVGVIKNLILKQVKK
ncbi:MAG: hypothetical protein MUC49_19455 [Raineya sp.]|jgi:hypothetical protein|nr:hypothetical protein [Raineya sp.]